MRAPKTFALLQLASAFVLTQSFSQTVHADDQWQKDHPKRAQVNKRLNNQQKRVDNGLASGKLNSQQAQKIQNQDARIKNQERRDAAQNGGHITKGEQKQLNREENHVNGEINRDESKNAGQ